MRDSSQSALFSVMSHHAPRWRNGQRPEDRRGAVLVLAAILMIFLMALLAFSIDTGYQMTMQTELQRSVDAAALAGAGVLVQGVDEAESRSVEYLARNPVGEQDNQPNEPVSDKVARFEANHVGDYKITTGHWDAKAINPETGRQGVMIESVDRPSTIRVELTKRDQPYFFAPVLGRDEFKVDAEAVAMYQPREIMVVLDLSGSMSDDSRLDGIPSMGKSTIINGLKKIYGELGSPNFGKINSFKGTSISSNNTNTIKKQLGLNKVPYPYPSGSWNDYINYVKSDRSVKNAGYRKKYGGLTLVNYWLSKQAAHDQTPDLWKGSAQPLASVKDAVEVFIEHIQEVDTDDRVGLVVYNSNNGEGNLEIGLTDKFDSISARAREFQAGHYHLWTNISAGLRVAREQLEKSGRPNTFKLIVLLTDGKPTWVNGSPDMNGAKASQALLQQAAVTASEGIPVMTISLGQGADSALMQQVADMTDGTHFNVPGGQSVEAYRQELMDVFYDIANDRPLKLVQ